MLRWPGDSTPELHLSCNLPPQDDRAQLQSSNFVILRIVIGKRKIDPLVLGAASPVGYSDTEDVLPGLYPPLSDGPALADAMGPVTAGELLAVENEGAGAAGRVIPVSGGTATAVDSVYVDGVVIDASDGGSAGKSKPPELAESGGVV